MSLLLVPPGVCWRFRPRTSGWRKLKAVPSCTDVWALLWSCTRSEEHVRGPQEDQVLSNQSPQVHVPCEASWLSRVPPQSHLCASPCRPHTMLELWCDLLGFGYGFFTGTSREHLNKVVKTPEMQHSNFSELRCKQIIEHLWIKVFHFPKMILDDTARD